MNQYAALQRLDAYLVEVRRHLIGLSASDADEIILELRAHVLDRLEGQALNVEAVDAALWAMGSPADVGQSNVAARVEDVHKSSGRLAALRNAVAVLRTGISFLVTTLVGGALSLSLLVFALAKLFYPDRVGIWRNGDHWTVGKVHALVHGHEVLGWMLLPLGLLAAALIGSATVLIGRARLREIRAMQKGPAAFEQWGR